MSTRFFTTNEAQNLRNWKYHVVDNSISTEILTPFWNYLIRFTPPEVAPNILTLAGFLCILQSAYLTWTSYSSYPILTTFANILLLFAYQTLDALDGKQARKIKNSSPVGELFDHTCDNLGVVFIILIVCWTYEITSLTVQWLLIQCIQIVFMWTHLVAFFQNYIEFGRWTGPGEVLLATLFFLGLRSVEAQEIFRPLHTHEWMPTILMITFIGLSISVCIYTAILTYCKAPTEDQISTPSRNFTSTRNGLFFCFWFRFFACTITYKFIQLDTLHVICDGLFWSMVTGDLILAKMAKRDLHPWVPIFAMLSVLHPWMVLVCSVYYYGQVFSDLCNELNISMFGVNQNVYVDGVFDLCHLGHKNLFKNALQFGNRLIVGVLSDQDVQAYKRKPVMTLDERVDAVSACRDVSEVVRGSPANGLSQEFLQKHNIHVVAHSPEYEKKDDHYYAVPRQLGMTRILPYTPGMSTSTLINRITERELEKSSLGELNYADSDSDNNDNTKKLRRRRKKM